MSGREHKIRTILHLMDENWPGMSPSQAGTAIAAQRLGRILQRAAQHALQEVGVTFTEFEALSALRAQPAPHRLTPSDLYDAMLISSGGLTKVLKGLGARGLVTRPKSGGDGRSRPVELTGEGRATAERAMKLVQSVEAPIVAAMAGPGTNVAALTDTLIGLVEAAEDASGEALNRTQRNAG